MRMSLGTPVADGPPPVDALFPIEADMAGNSGRVLVFRGLPFPRGLAFGEGNGAAPDPDGPKDPGGRGGYDGHLPGRRPAWGLVCAATTHVAVLAGERLPDRYVAPRRSPAKSVRGGSILN
jgi:hypothetical protein